MVRFLVLQLTFFIFYISPFKVLFLFWILYLLSIVIWWCCCLCFQFWFIINKKSSFWLWRQTIKHSFNDTSTDTNFGFVSQSHVIETRDAIENRFSIWCQVFVLVSFSVSFAKSGVHAFVLRRFPLSRFKTFLLLFVFAFLVSNDSLILRLWYCYLVNKVLDLSN